MPLQVIEAARVTTGDVQGDYTVGKRRKREMFASWLEPHEGLYSLSARPIFQVGKWKGREYSKADLAGVVEAFHATLNQLKPRVKLGHDDKQAFAGGTSPGTPALGFVSDVYLNEEYTDRASGKTVAAGTQLLADFVNIPRELYEPLVRLSYPERSIELLVDYPDAEKPGKHWPLALKAVAFLGDELPAVRGLAPLVEMFDESALPSLTLTFAGGYPMPLDGAAPAAANTVGLEQIMAVLSEMMTLLKAKMPESDEEMAAKAEAEKEKMAASPAPAVPTTPAAPVPQVVANAEDIIKQLQAEVAASKAAITTIQEAREADARRTELSAFVEELSSEKQNRIPAAEKGRALYLLEHAPNGQTLKFSEGGKDESYLDALKGLLSNMPDRAHLFGVKTRQFSQPTRPDSGSLADKAQKLAAEKKITFADALTTLVQEIGEEGYIQAVHGDA